MKLKRRGFLGLLSGVVAVSKTVKPAEVKLEPVKLPETQKVAFQCPSSGYVGPLCWYGRPKFEKDK